MKSFQLPKVFKITSSPVAGVAGMALLVSSPSSESSVEKIPWWNFLARIQSLEEEITVNPSVDGLDIRHGYNCHADIRPPPYHLCHDSVIPNRRVLSRRDTFPIDRYLTLNHVSGSGCGRYWSPSFGLYKG